MVNKAPHPTPPFWPRKAFFSYLDDFFIIYSANIYEQKLPLGHSHVYVGRINNGKYILISGSLCPSTSWIGQPVPQCLLNWWWQWRAGWWVDKQQSQQLSRGAMSAHIWEGKREAPKAHFLQQSTQSLFCLHASSLHLFSLKWIGVAALRGMCWSCSPQTEATEKRGCTQSSPSCWIGGYPPPRTKEGEQRDPHLPFSLLTGASHTPWHAPLFAWRDWAGGARLWLVGSNGTSTVWQIHSLADPQFGMCTSCVRPEL